MDGPECGDTADGGTVGRRPFLAAATAWGGLAVSGCVGRPWGEEQTKAWTEQYDPPGGGQVTVENIDGPVTVRGADRGTIGLSVEKRSTDGEALDRVRVRAEPDGDGFAVRAEHLDDPDAEPPTVELLVTVPRTYPVERVRTVNGDVSVDGTRGDLQAGTVNGDVDVDGVRGYVRIEAGNGDLSATRTTGIDDLSVSNGDVDADVRAIRTDSRIATTNGDVDVRFGPGLDAEIRAEATSGRVDADGVELENASRGPRTATGSLGERSHQLTVETANGVVTLSML